MGIENMKSLVSDIYERKMMKRECRKNIMI